MRISKKFEDFLRGIQRATGLSPEKVEDLVIQGADKYMVSVSQRHFIVSVGNADLRRVVGRISHNQLTKVVPAVQSLPSSFEGIVLIVERRTENDPVFVIQWDQPKGEMPRPYRQFCRKRTNPQPNG